MKQRNTTSDLLLDGHKVRKMQESEEDLHWKLGERHRNAPQQEDTQHSALAWLHHPMRTACNCLLSDRVRVFTKYDLCSSLCNSSRLPEGCSDLSHCQSIILSASWKTVVFMFVTCRLILLPLSLKYFPSDIQKSLYQKYYYKVTTFKVTIFYIGFKKLTDFLCILAKYILNFCFLTPFNLKDVSNSLHHQIGSYMTSQQDEKLSNLLSKYFVTIIVLKYNKYILQKNKNH